MALFGVRAIMRNAAWRCRQPCMSTTSLLLYNMQAAYRQAAVAHKIRHSSRRCAGRHSCQQAALPHWLRNSLAGKVCQAGQLCLSRERHQIFVNQYNSARATREA